MQMEMLLLLPLMWMAEALPVVPAELLQLLQLSFSCENLGANTVTLTVKDSLGNIATCSATVTIEDNTAPNAVCKDVTINLLMA